MSVAIAAAAVVGEASADVPPSCVGVWRGGRSGRAAESYLVIRSDSIGRNVKDTPEAALRSVRERLAEQRREIQHRRDEKLEGKSRKGDRR